jgi:hypothetical protein
MSGAQPAAELLALVVSDTAVVDEAGKVSLQGLFDCIWATGFPTRHAQLAVFWKARFREPCSLRTVIEGPAGQAVALTERVDVEGPGLAQAIHLVTNLEFPVAGEYLVRLLGDRGQVGVTTLEVRMRQ